MDRLQWLALIAVVGVASPARADLSTYADRVSARPYFLPDGVAELGAQANAVIAPNGATGVDLLGRASLGGALEGALSVDAVSFRGGLLTPRLELRVPFTPDIGMQMGVAATTDFRGTAFLPTLGLGARFHVASRVAVDLPGLSFTYAKLAGSPCLNQSYAPPPQAPSITSTSTTSSSSSTPTPVTASCLELDGSPVTSTFSSGSMPEAYGIHIPLDVVVSPVDLLTATLGVEFTYAAQSGGPNGAAAVTPVAPAAQPAPLIANSFGGHLDVWKTDRALDLGIRLAYLNYFDAHPGYDRWTFSFIARIR